MSQFNPASFRDGLTQAYELVVIDLESGTPPAEVGRLLKARIAKYKKEAAEEETN